MARKGPESTTGASAEKDHIDFQPEPPATIKHLAWFSLILRRRPFFGAAVLAALLATTALAFSWNKILNSMFTAKPSRPSGGFHTQSDDSPVEPSPSRRSCLLTVLQPECTLDDIGISMSSTFFDKPTQRAKIEFFGTISDNAPVSILVGGSGTTQVIASDGSMQTLALNSQSDSKQITVTIRGSK